MDQQSSTLPAPLAAEQVGGGKMVSSISMTGTITNKQQITSPSPLSLPPPALPLPPTLAPLSTISAPLTTTPSVFLPPTTSTTHSAHRLYHTFPTRLSTPPASPPLTDFYVPPKDDNPSSNANSNPQPVLRLRPGSADGETADGAKDEEETVAGDAHEHGQRRGFEDAGVEGEDFYDDVGDSTPIAAATATGIRCSGSGEYEHNSETAHLQATATAAASTQHGSNEADSDSGNSDSESRKDTPRPRPRPRSSGVQTDAFIPSFHESQAVPLRRGWECRCENEDEDEHVLVRDYEDGDTLWGADGDGQDFRRANAPSPPPLAAGLPTQVSSPPPLPISPLTQTHPLPPTEHYTPSTSTIQLLTPQGTIGAQWDEVLDIHVSCDIGRTGGGGYGIREIRREGGIDEVRRGWSGVKGCVVVLVGGDVWEFVCKGMGEEVDGGDRDDEDEDEWLGSGHEVVDDLQGVENDANPDFELAPAALREKSMGPFAVDVVDEWSDWGVGRYVDVAEYRVVLGETEGGKSLMVRVRDVRGEEVEMWRRAMRVEIVLVDGVVVSVDVGERGRDDGVSLRGGAGDEGVLEKMRYDGCADELSQGATSCANATVGRGKSTAATASSEYSDYESEISLPKRTREEKGKGKAVETADTTAKEQYLPGPEHYHSDQDDYYYPPSSYENPADYLQADYCQTTGSSRHIGNPEPDYILGSCPCLDRPITADADADPGSLHCTCSQSPTPVPTSPAPEPWTNDLLSARYQAFLRAGPLHAPYSHSCTAHSDVQGVWVGEVERKHAAVQEQTVSADGDVDTGSSAAARQRTEPGHSTGSALPSLPRSAHKVSFKERGSTSTAPTQSKPASSDPQLADNEILPQPQRNYAKEAALRSTSEEILIILSAAKKARKLEKLRRKESCRSASADKVPEQRPTNNQAEIIDGGIGHSSNGAAREGRLRWRRPVKRLSEAQGAKILSRTTSMPLPIRGKRSAATSPRGVGPKRLRPEPGAQRKATQNGSAPSGGGLHGIPQATRSADHPTDFSAHANPSHHFGQRDNVPLHVRENVAMGNMEDRGVMYVYPDRYDPIFHSFQGHCQFCPIHGLQRHPRVYPYHARYENTQLCLLLADHSLIIPPSQFSGLPFFVPDSYFPPLSSYASFPPTEQYQHTLPNSLPQYHHLAGFPDINHQHTFSGHYDHLAEFPNTNHHHRHHHHEQQHTPSLHNHATPSPPQIPENTYFYPDGHPARLRFPKPPACEGHSHAHAHQQPHTATHTHTSAPRYSNPQGPSERAHANTRHIHGQKEERTVVGARGDACPVCGWSAMGGVA